MKTTQISFSWREAKPNVAALGQEYYLAMKKQSSVDERLRRCLWRKLYEIKKKSQKLTYAIIPSIIMFRTNKSRETERLLM